ncbi:unnamed protein product [Angiostrongylus costaricensis]|uniref:G_PROTEIN_RECEP_F1_2 domain-containing protein n=1 Tax=Angiostrongylus costaricensis TaxID=334426 RepID=A0A0R3Q248_ANGCS|nr:unnamed protein product [Angiostrongylus costaricensis]
MFHKSGVKCLTIRTDQRSLGTEHVEVKIYLIGVFATFIAILSIIFNTFFTIVFLTNESIKKSSAFYFGILAVIDTIMAVNYIAVMSLPVSSVVEVITNEMRHLRNTVRRLLFDNDMSAA